MQVLTMLQEALTDAREFYQIQVDAKLDYEYNHTPLEIAIMVIEDYNLPRDVEQYAISKLKQELV